MSGTGDVIISVERAGVAYWQKAGCFCKKRYWALRDISFELHRGETLGIIGKNGVGKSTLMRLLAGIIATDRGRLRCHNASVSLLSLQAGFVPQLTGRENAVLNGMMLGIGKKEILSRMPEIEAYADIGAFFDQPVYAYSMGMKARVGFSIAIHARPDVILLDEVLGVGDADFRKKSAQSMRDRIDSHQTVVLVSHQMGLIGSVCDRVVWIEEGCVRDVGETQAVLADYKKSNQEKL